MPQETTSMKLVNFRNEVAQIMGLRFFLKDAATKAVDFTRLSLEAVREDLDRQCEDQAGKFLGVDLRKKSWVSNLYREHFDVILWKVYGKGWNTVSPCFYLRRVWYSMIYLRFHSWNYIYIYIDLGNFRIRTKYIILVCFLDSRFCWSTWSFKDLSHLKCLFFLAKHGGIFFLRTKKSPLSDR